MPLDDDILRLKYCPLCGYDLRGLAREGKCPECSFSCGPQMFSLIGKRTNPLPDAGFAVLLVYIALDLIIISPRGYALATGAILAAGVIAYFCVPQVRRLLRSQQEWLLFTAEGIASKHTTGKFQMIPWEDFKRVSLQRPFTFARREPGMVWWEIRLYREPMFHLLNPESAWRWLRFRKTRYDIVFRFQANEEDARRVVGELRHRFSRGWQTQTNS